MAVILRHFCARIPIMLLFLFILSFSASGLKVYQFSMDQEEMASFLWTHEQTRHTQMNRMASLMWAGNEADAVDDRYEDQSINTATETMPGIPTHLEEDPNWCPETLIDPPTPPLEDTMIEISDDDKPVNKDRATGYVNNDDNGHSFFTNRR